MYCKNCGAPLDDRAYTCPNCGYKVDNPYYEKPYGKSMIASGLLAIFLGPLGIHNFYLRRFKCAGVQLGLSLLSVVVFLLGIPLTLTAPTLGVTFLLFSVILGPAIGLGVWLWAIVEAILIFSGKIKDGDGNELV